MAEGNGRSVDSIRLFSAAEEFTVRVLCHVTSGKEARKNHSASLQSVTSYLQLAK